MLHFIKISGIVYSIEKDNYSKDMYLRDCYKKRIKNYPVMQQFIASLEDDLMKNRAKEICKDIMQRCEDTQQQDFFVRGTSGLRYANEEGCMNCCVCYEENRRRNRSQSCEQGHGINPYQTSIERRLLSNFDLDHE